MIDAAFTLEQKTAIVVGAVNGIGRATALAFAASGARVVCADVEAQGAKATAADIETVGGQAQPVHLDVTDGASCRAAVATTVERFGGLDVLLYGAADSDRAATVLEMDEAAWDRVIRINLTGAFLMVKAAIPAMIARGGGSVILYRVAARPRGLARARGVLRDQRRPDPARESARRRSRGAGHPCQHDLAGAIETRRMLRRHKDMDEARRMMGPEAPARPPRPARGDRPRRHLSRERAHRRS